LIVQSLFRRTTISKNLVAQFNEEQRLEREEQLREELELEDLYYSDLEYDQYCPCGCCNDSYLDEYLDTEMGISEVLNEV
jgi:hypothetical protein